MIAAHHRYHPRTFWASCDGSSLFRFSADSTTPLLKFEHGIDLIKELALNMHTLLASGIQKNLVLRSISTGELLHRFTTQNLMQDPAHHRINGLASVEFNLTPNQPQTSYLGHFVIGSDSNKLFVYDSNSRRTVSANSLTGKEVLIDIEHIQGTLAIVVNTNRELTILAYPQLNEVSTFELPSKAKLITKLRVQNRHIFVGDESGMISVLRMTQNFMNYLCKSTTNELDGKCTSSCIEGYQVQAEACSPRCPSPNIFSTELFKLNPSGNYCVPNCAANNFLNFTRNCDLCDSSCKTCIFGGKNGCSSCDLAKSQFSKLSHDGQCQSSCAVASFEASAGICKSCPINCATCKLTPITSDPQNIECLSCLNTTFTLINSQTPNARCSEICEKGYYLEGTVCHECRWGCDECTNFEPGSCQKCTVGYFSYQGNCFANSCPPGTFG